MLFEGAAFGGVFPLRAFSDLVRQGGLIVIVNIRRVAAKDFEAEHAPNCLRRLEGSTTQIADRLNSECPYFHRLAVAKPPLRDRSRDPF